MKPSIKRYLGQQQQSEIPWSTVAGYRAAASQDGAVGFLCCSFVGCLISPVFAQADSIFWDVCLVATWTVWRD